MARIGCITDHNENASVQSYNPTFFIHALQAVSAAEEVAAPAVIKELADLEGVPALPECRVRLQWEADEQAAARVAEKEGGRTSSAQLAVRDSEGMYSPEEPFWAPVKGAVLMTAADSDRRVRNHFNNPSRHLPNFPETYLTADSS